ncbi:hypothetical protein WICPIJ_002221 [Wickerhamomyces pijperi]|uniref:Zn(2)-C6 fungal-type domain-containing protein n=1 Tax=Wickerhamomyces pijperi TaxID=599730 RepID=A0A9P8QCA7_WICPI|nr:hypothetical protein WICPIJ_002221 [Wickerhamomyces pijperi]
MNFDDTRKSDQHLAYNHALSEGSETASFTSRASAMAPLTQADTSSTRSSNIPDHILSASPSTSLDSSSNYNNSNSNNITVQTIDTSRPNAKHISRACLQCRHRHLKCDGKLPKCTRCEIANKDECSYVKSKRGGSRKKGVSTKTVKNKKNKNEQSADPSPRSFPCYTDDGSDPSCPNGHDRSTCSYLSDKTFNKLPCTDKQITIELTQDDVIKYDIFKVELNVDNVINSYYNNFHAAHPVLPPLADFHQFFNLLGSPRELLIVMNLIAEGYETTKYSTRIEEVFQIAVKLKNYINSNDQDIVTLQTLILLSLVCHISALHDLAYELRRTAIELVVKLGINNQDLNEVDQDINGNLNDTQEFEINMNYLTSSKRIRNLTMNDIKENSRRCFWELFFLDIIIGSSDAISLSKLTNMTCFIRFPSIPSRLDFDYETRAYTSKLVDDAVRLNNNSNSSNSSNEDQYFKLTASLYNWELKFSNPDLYKIPYLLNSQGDVNNGIQQGLIMLNYAKIFTHRPLSFLWKDNIPKNFKSIEKKLSTSDKNATGGGESKASLMNSRRIIETRKTIDAANLITKTLIDTNPLNILQRTPLNACSLAFACLVHLSAYIWSSQSNNSASQQQDLSIYEEYIKLELSGIYKITTHWYLSSKILNYLMDNIKRLLPDLYKKLSGFFKILDMKSQREAEELNKISQQMSYGSIIPPQMVEMDPSILTEFENFGYGKDDQETGCDWIDKNQIFLEFDGTEYDFNSFDLNLGSENGLSGFDDLVRSMSSSM